MDTRSILLSPISIGTKTAPNRIAMNAMECCDADPEGAPSDVTFERYENLFTGNAGMIIVEALSVIDESKGRLNQLLALPKNENAFKAFVRRMKDINSKPLMIWQLTHSGELSNEEFSTRVCAKPLPGLGGKLLTEDEVEYILDKFVEATKIAHDCGADGVDFKLCHGYFGSQLLRPYNDRDWKYGGSFENRTRFAYEYYERVDREINDPDFLVGSKISVWEGFPGGMGTADATSAIIDLAEVKRIVKGIEERGASFVIQSAGSPSITLALTQPDRSIPDYAYLHFLFQKELNSVLKPETALIGSAYSIFRNGRNKFLAVNQEESSFEYWAAKNISEGICDMAALGRQSLADPLLPLKIEENRKSEIHWCTACDNCVEFLIRQEHVGCSTYQRKYTEAFRKIRKEKGKLIEKHT